MDQTIIPHNVTIPNLLSISQDAKTIKGEKHGYLSAIQYLRPDSVLCPHATPECFSACLNTAGRGVFPKTQQARLNRSQFFKKHLYGLYDIALLKQIEKFIKKAKKLSYVPVFRPNGTSDIVWENLKLLNRYICGNRTDLVIYDYTKTLDRPAITRPNDFPNYHLTFSYSGHNWRECQIAFHEYGHNIAVVFRDKLPNTWRGIPVLNGDISDLRFLDPAGHIVGLKAKGKARTEKSAFVVDYE